MVHINKEELTIPKTFGAKLRFELGPSAYRATILTITPPRLLSLYPRHEISQINMAEMLLSFISTFLLFSFLLCQPSVLGPR